MQALEGVKVLDFGWALVGSWTSKYLADYGARVVKIESSAALDRGRTSRIVSVTTADPNSSPWFAHLNTSKYGMRLDLKHPLARGVVERLIRWADVVCENFTPGTIGKLGFGYEQIKKIKPEIIMTGGSIFGQTGPRGHESGTDLSGRNLSGLRDLMGWPDRPPVAPGGTTPYGDAVTPFLIASAIVAALDYRRRTGKGQYIDASMLEVIAHTITPAFLDWQMNGHLQTRRGNRIPNAAPHGVFPCIGDDRWCVIAIFTDEEWQAFCHVIGDPAWTKEQKFSTLCLRKENEGELDELVAEWTNKHTAEEVMHSLQGAGVAAGIVQDAQEVFEKDPQLKERGFFVFLEHPVLGVFAHPVPPFKLLRTRALVKTPPCLGEHTEQICTQWLGMSHEQFAELSQKGVFT